MFSKAFWVGLAERALKTGAQVLLALLGVDGAGIMHMNWTVTGATVGGAMLASVLTSFVAAGNPPGTEIQAGKHSLPEN